MKMLRSMYAGISGMKNFQTKLDVIGNNIANVNTSGFKKGRVTFQDMMSQMTSGAQGPTATRGGINPAQVGLGAQLGSIDNIHTQGFRQTTNNPLDFALEGDGMFVVQDGAATYYTRAGNFYLDQDGYIVNPQGMYLMGYGRIEGEGLTAEDEQGNYVEISTINGVTSITLVNSDSQGNVFDNVTPEVGLGEDGETIETYTTNWGDVIVTTDLNGEITVELPESIGGQTVTGSLVEVSGIDYNVTGPISLPENAQSFSVQKDGTVNFVDENGNPQVAGQIVLANFSNPAGLEKAGSNLFLNSTNAGYTGLIIPETDGASIISGALEMSNVDLAEEFTEMITAQRGFQANTRIITTSDEILQELVNLKR